MRREKRGELNTAPRKMYNGRRRRKKTLMSAAHHTEETTAKATLQLGLRLCEEGCLDEDTIACRVVAVGRAREVAVLQTAGLEMQTLLFAWTARPRGRALSARGHGAWQQAAAWTPRGRSVRHGGRMEEDGLG
jgi:uncharacterized membrane protein